MDLTLKKLKELVVNYEKLNIDDKIKICKYMLDDVKGKGDCDIKILPPDNYYEKSKIEECKHINRWYESLIRKNDSNEKICINCNKTFEIKKCELAHLCIGQCQYNFNPNLKIDMNCEDCDEIYSQCLECCERVCFCGLCDKKTVCNCEFRFESNQSN